MSINKKSFCGAPWHILRVMSRGNYAVCCQHKQTESTELFAGEITIDQWRNSEYLTKLRQQFLNGEFPSECERCYVEEASGKLTIRNKVNANYVKWDQIETYKADTPENLREIQFDLGNLCNLRCTTCKPTLSTQVLQDWKKLGWFAGDDRKPEQLSGVSVVSFHKKKPELIEPHPSINNESTLEDENTWVQSWYTPGSNHVVTMPKAHLDYYENKEFLESFKRNIIGVTNLRFLGGEPFLNPNLEDFIDAVPDEQAKDMTLLITTNATIFDEGKKIGRAHV